MAHKGLVIMMTKGTVVKFRNAQTPEDRAVLGTVTQEIDQNFVWVKWQDREDPVIMRRDSLTY